MFVDSHLGHFSPASGCGIFAILARSVIDPGLIEPGPPPPLLPPSLPLPPPPAGGGGGGRC